MTKVNEGNGIPDFGKIGGGTMHMHGGGVPAESVDVVDGPSDRRRVNDANSQQIGGTHYKYLAIEPWDQTVLNNRDVFQHEIIAYVERWRTKGGIQDLEKAVHWLQKYIEVEKARQAVGEFEMRAQLLSAALKKLTGEK